MGEYDETKAIKAVFNGPPPKLGRIVHISRRNAPSLAAIITAVMPDGMHINATAFEPHDVGLRSYTSLRQGGPDQPNTWYWPPRD